MGLYDGQLWQGVFVTLDDKGALKAATETPVGTLYINHFQVPDPPRGGYAVEITGTNPYMFSVYIPSNSHGAFCALIVTAKIENSKGEIITTSSVVAQDFVDTVPLGPTPEAGNGEVRVSDENGYPLAQVRVDIYTQPYDIRREYYFTGGYTSLDGVFRFYAPAGKYYARLYKMGYKFPWLPIEVEVQSGA